MATHRDPAEYAISSWLYVAEPIDVALRKIAGAGFRLVELWGDQAHVDPRVKPDVRAIKALVKSLKLKVSSIHCPFGQLDIGSPDEAAQQRWLDVVGASLPIGADLGARVAVVHIRSFREVPLSADMERKSWDLTFDFVQKLHEQARGLGMRLAIENRGASAALTGFAVSLPEICRLFPDPDLGLCLDIGHAAIRGRDFASEIRGAGARLLATHVHSNDGVRDLHLLPGRGVPDWQMIKGELKAIGFQGVNTLELNGSVEPDATLAASVEFVAEERRLARSSAARA